MARISVASYPLTMCHRSAMASLTAKDSRIRFVSIHLRVTHPRPPSDGPHIDSRTGLALDTRSLLGGGDFPHPHCPHKCESQDFAAEGSDSHGLVSPGPPIHASSLFGGVRSHPDSSLAGDPLYPPPDG